MNVVYSYIYGTKEEYRNQVINLFKSIKESGSQADRILFTDKDNFDFFKSNKLFTKVIEKSYTKEQHKLLTFKFDVISDFDGVYDNCLWFDTDMYVFMNIDNLFNILNNRVQILWSPAHGREGRNRDKNLVFPEIPDDFPHPNAGLVGLNAKVYKDWVNNYFDIEKDYPKNMHLENEQQIMRKVLFENNYNTLLLPEEYNFNSIDSLNYWVKNKHVAKPKIFHYTLNKHNYLDVVKFIKSNWYEK